MSLKEEFSEIQKGTNEIVALSEKLMEKKDSSRFLKTTLNIILSEIEAKENKLNR
ncbi:MAG: hypothetical protein GY714_09195 [Desulfobacterales bacterium]|nr:hypothetical protein [Desulfobacterales bacterium]